LFIVQMFAETINNPESNGNSRASLPYRSASADQQYGSTDYSGPSRLNPRMIQGQNNEFTENAEGDNDSGVQGILNSLIDNNKSKLMQDDISSIFSNGLLGANNSYDANAPAGLTAIDKALDQASLGMQSMYISDGTQGQNGRNVPTRGPMPGYNAMGPDPNAFRQNPQPNVQVQYVDSNGMGVAANGQQAYYLQQPVYVDASGQPIYYARVPGDGQYQQNLMYAPDQYYNPVPMGPNGAPYQYGQMDPNMMRKGRPPFPNGMRGMPYDPTMMMAGPNMMPRGDEMYMMNGGRKNMGKDFNRDGSSRGNRNDGYKNSNNPPPAANPMQDPLVDDFRSTYGKTKQWNLIDLQGHVVAFCQDQHGSRFIQQRLEVCSDADKQLIFDEILPTAQSLMTDVFGNYVLQKLFEFGTPDQCESLARLLTNQCVQLSMQMYGCRVVQKALEYVGTDRLIAIVGEFENPPVLLRCVHDSNGNHVIQKCIEITSKAAQDSDTQPEVAEYLNSRIEIFIEAFKGRIKELSSHPYGCRVIQRILEHGSNDQKTIILEELRQYYPELIQDMYGNYVIQFVMQHGWESDRQILIKEVQSKLLDFSQHKFASNVVERCLQFANKKDKDEMIWAIINATFDLNNPVDAKTGHCVLESMVRDPYGNYVVQKVIDVSDERQRGAIMRYIKENIVQLRRYTYGKHIIVRLEKITGEKF